jgi:hypothetical protein
MTQIKHTFLTNLPESAHGNQRRSHIREDEDISNTTSGINEIDQNNDSTDSSSLEYAPSEEPMEESSSDLDPDHPDYDLIKAAKLRAQKRKQ